MDGEHCVVRNHAADPKSYLSTSIKSCSTSCGESRIGDFNLGASSGIEFAYIRLYFGDCMLRAVNG